MVRSGVNRLVVGSGVHGLMVGSSVDGLMVGSGLVVRGGVVNGDLVIDGGRVGNHGGDVTSNLWCVDWGGVVHRLHWSVGWGGGGVAVHSGVVDGSVMGWSSVVDRTSSLGISLSVDCNSCNCQDL